MDKEGKLARLSDAQLKVIIRSRDSENSDARIAALKVLAARRALRKVSKNPHVHPKVRAAARAALSKVNS